MARSATSEAGGAHRWGVLPELQGSLQAFPYLAIELLQERDAALGTLLVVAHHPKLLSREAFEASRNLLHAQFLVVLDGKAGGAQTLLGVGEPKYSGRRSRSC